MKVIYAGGFHAQVPDTISVNTTIDDTGFTIEIRDKKTGQVILQTGTSVESGSTEDQRTLKSLYATITVLGELLADTRAQLEEARRKK